MPAQPKPLKIFIFAVDGAGHMNACVGLAQALKARGHHITFLLNSGFKDQYSVFGFDEILLEESKPQNAPTVVETDSNTDDESDILKKSGQMILKSGFMGPKSPLEKIKDNIANGKTNFEFMQMLFQTIVDFCPQIEAAILKERPDVFILDHVLVPPPILKHKVRWVYSFSANPMTLFNSKELPPFGSGYSINSDRALWDEFNAAQKQMMDLGGDTMNFQKYQQKLCDHFNYQMSKDDNPFLNEDQLMPQSKYLNVYGFPEELDYTDIVPIGPNFVRVDAFCRYTPEPFTLPEGFQKPGEKLIYFSLGSMGSIDVELVQKVLSVLAKTSYKCIVSKGQRADEYDLPANCWGDRYLPQTNILPLVDLVITHGGNNTVTETFSFGKPMIVMPLFGDQYDNAQRVHDKEYGIQLEPYSFEEAELLDAIEKLMWDDELRAKLDAVAKRMKTSNSKEKACERIEALVEQF